MINGLLNLKYKQVIYIFLGDGRTNNDLEGNHNGINVHYDCDHPNVWLFLKKLKAYQVKMDVKMREFSEKGVPAKRRATSYDWQKSLCERYNEFSLNPLEFINEMAKLL